MKKLYIITGANGHLGSTIIRRLSRKNCKVRGLILPGETPEKYWNVTYYEGDVTKPESLDALFSDCGNQKAIVIHTAGLISISDKITPMLYEVNVNGTKNMIQKCLQHGVKRLVHVSSVHAIPEEEDQKVTKEASSFSREAVRGAYAKTKAEATQAVLDAVKEGLDAVVVQPSGILGPYGNGDNHLIQMVSDYMKGTLPACVRGGYDFVDVRDVAAGCLRAAEYGKTGNCYILSNRYCEIKNLLAMVKKVYGGKKLPVLPMWMARAAQPFIALDAKRKKRRPLYTRYSLYTLRSNGKFSHEKATSELWYMPRKLEKTIRDTVNWLMKKA